MARHDIRFNINEQLHLKDPQMTDFGKKVLTSAIKLFHNIGFEKFTFKKLAHSIETNEASVYRYFENKHKLLLWLECWYWELVNYLIEVNTTNIEDPHKLLCISIHQIVNVTTIQPVTNYIDQDLLHEVIISEGSKAYHVHNVDDENKSGYYHSYNEVVAKVSKTIQQVAPKFKYPNLLASNIFEMANNQLYFSQHMPELTDIKYDDNVQDSVESAIKYLVSRMLQVDHPVYSNK
jgi:hypothetical protein